MLDTKYEHIQLDENQVPYISGSTMKVIELVINQNAFGWSPEELHFQHPYLTLGQIYSALAYYWDHRAELDADIEDRLKKVNQIQAANPTNSLVERLKSKGLI